jgi:hypothetical protein
MWAVLIALNVLTGRPLRLSVGGEAQTELRVVGRANYLCKPTLVRPRAGFAKL